MYEVICDRTHKIIAFGSGEMYFSPSRCGCGALVTTVTEPSGLGYGCEAMKAIDAARTALESSVFATLRQYNVAVMDIWQKFDLYDSDGNWNGDDENEYTLNAPYATQNIDKTARSIIDIVEGLKNAV